MLPQHVVEAMQHELQMLLKFRAANGDDSWLHTFSPRVPLFEHPLYLFLETWTCVVAGCRPPVTTDRAGLTRRKKGHHHVQTPTPPSPPPHTTTTHHHPHLPTCSLPVSGAYICRHLRLGQARSLLTSIIERREKATRCLRVPGLLLFGTFLLRRSARVSLWR